MKFTPKFMEWLHALTLLGYDDEIIISIDYMSEVNALFKAGKSPEEAIIEYKNLVTPKPNHP